MRDTIDIKSEADLTKDHIEEAFSTERALKLALEALEQWHGYMPQHWDKWDEEAVIALRTAIEAAEKAEPVAITERMAFAFHNAITDGAIGSDDLMDIMRGLEAAHGIKGDA